MLIQRDDFAVDDAVGQLGGVLGDCAEAVGPIKTLARADDRAALFNPDLRSIAVEFHFVCPTGLVRRPVNQFAQLRLNEFRHGAHHHGLRANRLRGARRFCAVSGRGSPSCAGLRCRARVRRMRRMRRGFILGTLAHPDRIRQPKFGGGQHEGLRRLPRAGRDLLHGSARGNRAVLAQQRIGAAWPLSWHRDA